MKKLKRILMKGKLEEIRVQKVQEDVNKVLTLPSKHLEFYNDEELKDLVKKCIDLNWDIEFELAQNLK